MNQEPRFHELILASASTGRKALLERLGLDFSVIAADIDETPLDGEETVAMVERLSRAKAATIASLHPGALVIGSDQAALHEGITAGKPGTVENACTALRTFSGGIVDFYTGLAVVHQQTGFQAFHMDHTQVRFRELREDEITRYVERDQPLDCAGAFRIESLGPSLFEEVVSKDPSALRGLPLIRLCKLLRQAGLTLP
jgi:septum formation protein